MSGHSRAATALVASATSIALLAAPAAAQSPAAAGSVRAADAAPQQVVLNRAALLSDLTIIARATALAQRPGWVTRLSVGVGGESVLARQVRDTIGGRDVSDFTVRGIARVIEVTVAGSGMYVRLPRTTQERAALALLRRPNAHWAFTADRAQRLTDSSESVTGAPSQVLVALRADGAVDLSTAHRSTAADGTRTYSLQGLTEGKPSGPLTITITPAGRLVRLQAVQDGTAASADFAFGPQRVLVPAAADTVTAQALATASSALTLDARVRGLAQATAQRLEAQRQSSGRGLRTAQVRSAVRAAVRRGVMPGLGGIAVTVTDVAYGARLSATNPFTGARVSYTVQLVNRHAVARAR